MEEARVQEKQHEVSMARRDVKVFVTGFGVCSYVPAEVLNILC